MHTSDTSDLGLSEAELQAMAHAHLDRNALPQTFRQMETPCSTTALSPRSPQDSLLRIETF